ncbi:hypothetical protein FB45DRAFT_167666 [Roridomyces roridus]|uniref:Uncharacterized protein n=1 Tax=Roridomyces roridus TaxID=1738132 RepID=A0AAD7FDZ3_9AGAR|nr:hypothetical protein FB45DRAFT_167666 [Roridomyces roridus]
MSPPHHPRPIPRVPPPQFLTTLDENWQMTDELMAEIERADLQQAQSHSHLDSSPKVDPAVERIRASERVSPKTEGQRRQRQPNSPTAASFSQAPRTPDDVSASYHTPLHSPNDSYNPYQSQDHGSPGQVTLARRASNSAPVLLAVGTQGQTPPLQNLAVHSRTPDRSLPVQEEQEDEVPATGVAFGDSRGPPRSSSPTPSSDLNPEGIGLYEANLLVHGGRDSRTGHREEDDDTLIDQDIEETMRSRAVPDEEGGYTPRSPTSGLPPDHPMEPDHHPRYSAQNNATIRPRARNGSTDQLGMRALDPSLFTQDNLDRAPPPRYRDVRDVAQDYERYDSRAPPSNAQAWNIHPDDMQHYMDHPTMQSYFNSPRPDAPIPPTPHSQTAAPSPSPLTYDARKDYPPFSPVAPAGSPYPYPFNHVRRNNSYPYTSRGGPPPAAINPSSIQEQIARQWQVYAQNQSLAGGHVSDSTFSPAATPFQGNGNGNGAYNPWVYLHANRTQGGATGAARLRDLRSMQSSPSHEPVALPIPPSVGVRKNRERPEIVRQVSARKPPPRVDSTQPRSTPEPVDPDEESSGEETAGETEDVSRFAVREEGSWVAAPVVDSGDDDWVDEEEDGDEEDLLELEYHPTFVSNIEKRRRRWDTRWDTLVQAFNALDRQTDATMVLLAAPSHTTKLHSLTSRSIKRHPAILQSPAMANLRVGFRHIAGQRRATRTHHASLADRLLMGSSSNLSSATGSDISREEDLKRALNTALGSLGALKGIYEQREARWTEEMRRISDDRQRVELLLRQVLGDDPGSPGQAM